MTLLEGTLGAILHQHGVHGLRRVIMYLVIQSIVLSLHCIHHPACILQHTRIFNAFPVPCVFTADVFCASLENTATCTRHVLQGHGCLPNSSTSSPAFGSSRLPTLPACRCWLQGQWRRMQGWLLLCWGIDCGDWLRLDGLPQPANERRPCNAPPDASCHPATSPISPLIFLSVNVPNAGSHARPDLNPIPRGPKYLRPPQNRQLGHSRHSFERSSPFRGHQQSTWSVPSPALEGHRPLTALLAQPQPQNEYIGMLPPLLLRIDGGNIPRCPFLASQPSTHPF